MRAILMLALFAIAGCTRLGPCQQQRTVLLLTGVPKSALGQWGNPECDALCGGLGPENASWLCSDDASHLVLHCTRPLPC